MTGYRLTVQHNLRTAMAGEVHAVAAALKRAVTRAGQDVQRELRAQARAGGFRDGGRSIANAWRLDVFPREGRGLNSLRPAAVVWSRMPVVTDAHDRGVIVRARGQRALAIPTPVNLISGGRGQRKRMRVTPQEMFRSGGFVVATRNPAVRLWCLPLETQTSKRGRLRLFAGRYAQVYTGAARGAQARRQQIAATRSMVPLFFLMRATRLRKRLDVERVRRGAAGLFATHARRELAALGAAIATTAGRSNAA